jgi:predicted transposase YbfD/YdcC
LTGLRARRPGRDTVDPAWLSADCPAGKDVLVVAHPSLRIADCFADLVDPRIERTKRHGLVDLITIALCGVMCGAESWVEVEDWGDAKLDWLRTWLDLPNGIPSHDTFGRVFSRIDPAQFEAGFLRWVQGVVAMTTAATAEAAASVVAIDGKTIRAARERTGNPLHVVSAWASAHRLVLGQEAVDAKSNEITAIPALLARLDLHEQVVTIDAMGCQRAIAAQIVEQGGDYVLAVKGNQADLHTNIQDSFALAVPQDTSRSVGKGHGRIEIRTCRTINDPALIAWLDPDGAWPGVRSIAQVEAERRIDDAVTRQTRYYLSSLPGEATVIASAVRSHWGIENQLHWVLDVAFREDASRARIGHSAANLALLRKLALNLLRTEPTRKHGVKASRLRAGWDNNYLLRVLGLQ